MRIGLFSWESLNSIRVGGVAVHASELANALAEKGNEVHIFTRKGEWWQKEHEEINGVFEHRVVFQPDLDFIQYMDNMCDAMAGCFHFVEHKYGKFDVLHGHDWHVVNALTNIKYSKGYGFIMTYHSTEWGRNGNNYGDSWFSKRIMHREWLGGYESERVVTVSNAMRYELMHQYQIPEAKISVVYNGVSPKNFEGEIDAGRVKERYGIWPLDPVILFAGRLSYQKGPDLLVEAIPRVLVERPDARFIFAGSGDMNGHIIGRASWLGVADKIRVLGYVPDEELIELFKACDVVCVPSRNEPFGIIVLEAWSAGKPVVATDVGGPSELIWNFVTGIKAYPNNPESIAWGIKYAINSPEFVKRTGKNCKRAVKDFSWDKIADRTLEIYKKGVR
ncbi:MAG: glycosyl transferase family 1 [Candidatus Altiarchaeales archaeon IMC4]|nr:MAG: glycosyl transferase family 1 [Candidatus Altiarchaeales archaeon IMC4]